MKLNKINNVNTLADLKQLDIGNYLIHHSCIRLGGEMGDPEFNVLQVVQGSNSKFQLLGNHFLFDRNEESPVYAVSEIIE